MGCSGLQQTCTYDDYDLGARAGLVAPRTSGLEYATRQLVFVVTNL